LPVRETPQARRSWHPGAGVIGISPREEKNVNYAVMALILAIEDEENIARLLRLRLERKGHQVVVKENGPEALAFLQGPPPQAPDLIICDVMMPGMDGYEVCRRVRALGLKTPFLFLTAKGQSEDKVRGMQSGADDYLTKPFDPHELEAKVEAHLRRR